MSTEQQYEQQIVQEIVGQVMNVTLDDGNANDELDHRNNSSSKSNNDESIALEVSHLNACDVSTDYTTDSEEANNKKDESLHSPKEEKQQMNISSVSGGKNEAYAVATNGFGDDSSMLEGKNNEEVSAMTNGIGDEPSLPHDSDNLVEELGKKEESPAPSLKEEEDGKQKKDISMMEGNVEVPAVTTTNNDGGVGEESDLPFNSTAGQNGGSALEVSNLLDVSATDSEESTKTAIPPTPKEEEKQQKDISMVEGKNGVPAMVSESGGGGESDLAFNSAVGQNDNKDDGTNNNNDMDSDTSANGGGDEEDKEVESKQQPPQKTNKTKMCSVL